MSPSCFVVCGQVFSNRTANPAAWIVCPVFLIPDTCPFVPAERALLVCRGRS